MARHERPKKDDLSAGFDRRAGMMLLQPEYGPEAKEVIGSLRAYRCWKS
jgi:hypothetical protein